MNQKRTVWLPPDGDARLIRFQQALAIGVGLVDGAAVPPHLELAAGEPPVGAVRFGAWSLEQEPVLTAYDDRGPLGVVRFGLHRPSPWAASELVSLPPPPDWRWTRGVLAVLVMSLPHGDPSFVLWSWERRCGWKSDPPRG